MRIVAGIVTSAATLFAAFLVVATLRAQEPTGEVRIEVKDPSGRPMEATGKLQNVATGVTISFQTDAQGSATVPGLAVGRYTVDVTKSGFTAPPYIIDITSGGPVTRTVQMAIGSQSYKVDVIGTTPLPGVERSLDEIASNVQTATANDIESSGALDLSEFMNRRLSGVYLNEIQGNPIQPDLNFHGYTASPLLGTPQGVSIYMDGVRLNQPFGDVVSWDLIPRLAVSTIAIMPGSNPLFGLNTLGGALAMQTKTGRTSPGTTVQALYGSYTRRAVEFEHGGSNAAGLNWYVAGNLFAERGWRDDSPSDVRQVFGSLGWKNQRNEI